MRRRIARPLSACSLLLSMAAAGLAAGQAPADDVTVHFSAIDPSGRVVTDLAPRDIVIAEGKVPLTISSLERRDEPVSVFIMLDMSGSQTFNVARNVRLGVLIASLLPRADRVRAGTFAEKIALGPDTPTDRVAVAKFIASPPLFGVASRIWDGVAAAMQSLAPDPGRRVVVLVTDGDDDDSALGLSAVIRRAQTDDVMVYGIGAWTYNVRGRSGAPSDALKKLVTETGGGYVETKRDTDLQAVAARVAEEVHGEYVLNFTPTVRDGKLHPISLTSSRPGLTLRARRNYVAARGE